jgi:hypothetical protein
MVTFGYNYLHSVTDGLAVYLHRVRWQMCCNPAAPAMIYKHLRRTV